jgi:prepilin-type N-terminal cleavage/methylation domain-containing protein
MNRHGFTLLELIIVVAIVIIMSAMGAIALGRSDVNSLQVNALQIQTLFDKARQTALSQRAFTCVSVSPSDGKFTLYLRPVPATSASASPMLNAPSQTFTLPSTMGLPSHFGLVLPEEPLSAYFNNATSVSSPFIRKVDNVSAASSKVIYLWFDGFGQPNVDALSSTTWPGTAGVPAVRNYGFVNIATSSGSLVIQVVVYASTGITGLIWIRK